MIGKTAHTVVADDTVDHIQLVLSRLERGESGRMIDCGIALAFGWKTRPDRSDAQCSLPEWHPPAGSLQPMGWRAFPPEFSTSIDAALTLPVLDKTELPIVWLVQVAVDLLAYRHTALTHVTLARYLCIDALRRLDARQR